MKELIIVVGLTLLGCLLFEWIAGDGESLRTISGEKLERLMLMYGE